ncbi:MAG: (Fe-S)-binding protein [Oligoflexia bacterium]|nr:(Fe-S)-binding protein [Oligoflexia bacterium]
MSERESERNFQKMLQVLRDHQSVHFEACVRCGLCGKSCHVYLSDPSVENLPVTKAQKVVGLQRKKSEEVDEKFLLSLQESVYGRCTGCGRCNLNCSIGLNIASIIRVGRTILSALGRTPEKLLRPLKNQLEYGNQMMVSADEMRETATWIASDLRLESGQESFDIPIDKEGARILYLVNPREIKFAPLSLMAAAGVFGAAKESWTLASRFFDVTNFGFIAGDDESMKQVAEAVFSEGKRLGVREVILSECGHGARVFKWDSGVASPLPTKSIIELLDLYIEQGRVRLDKKKNAARVTLHDPCNLVRWSGVSEAQRRVLREACADFKEMIPNRAQNYCCGGGGGMQLLQECSEVRLRSAEIKANQIRSSGAKVVATPCHTCIDQLTELNKKYQLKVEISTVTELVYNALLY